MDLCDQCVHFVYDEDWECYSCDVNLDEDDMVKFLQGRNTNCSFFRLDDEYGVAMEKDTLTGCLNRAAFDLLRVIG